MLLRYILSSPLISHLLTGIDVQEFRGTGQAWLLQWGCIPSCYTGMWNMVAGEPLDIFAVRQGLHGTDWRPNGNGQRRNKYLRPKIVSIFVSQLTCCSQLILCDSSQDEIHQELRFTGAGILAMANSGPNSNGEWPTSVVMINI